MSSVYRFAAVIALLLAAGAVFASTPPLRVCSDSNNLPFSNEQGQGFENALARMVAHDLGRELQFVWMPQARSIQKSFVGLNCDLLMGVSASSNVFDATIPYYRSSYVFISRQDRHLVLASLTDPQLAKYRIGAQIIGGGDAAVPPAEEMARHGLVRNIVGFSMYGHPLDNPAAQLIDAVIQGKVDLAVAWGPTAGYFAKTSSVPLTISPICPLTEANALPLSFNVSMAVRKGDTLTREQLNRIIARRHQVIRTLLVRYGVPLVDGAAAAAGCR